MNALDKFIKRYKCQYKIMKNILITIVIPGAIALIFCFIYFANEKSNKNKPKEEQPKYAISYNAGIGVSHIYTKGDVTYFNNGCAKFIRFGDNDKDTTTICGSFRVINCR